MYELSDWQQAFIEQAITGGRRVAAQSGVTFVTINPITGQVLLQVAICGEAEVELAA